MKEEIHEKQRQEFKEWLERIETEYCDDMSPELLSEIQLKQHELGGRTMSEKIKKELCECRCGESVGEYCCDTCPSCGSMIKYTRHEVKDDE